MFRFIAFSICFYSVSCYFTLPGKCPENVSVQENFVLADFFDKWYQAYHYSSDGLHKNNCSTLNLVNKPYGIYVNQSRIDRGLFHRYSMGRLEIPSSLENAADMQITFTFENAPRRLKTRKYPFRVLSTNYKFYATVYTCGYSPLVDKHFIYVWILSRKPILNDVSKELAVANLHKIKVSASDLVKDDWSRCSPKYYDDFETEPMTFRYPVPL